MTYRARKGPRTHLSELEAELGTVANRFIEIIQVLQDTPRDKLKPETIQFLEDYFSRS